MALLCCEDMLSAVDLAKQLLAYVFSLPPLPATFFTPGGAPFKPASDTETPCFINT
jgi:hypothetical protein